MPFVDMYRDAARRAGHQPANLPLGIDSIGYIADTAQQAANDFYPSYAAMMNKNVDHAENYS